MHRGVEVGRHKESLEVIKRAEWRSLGDQWKRSKGPVSRSLRVGDWRPSSGFGLPLRNWGAMILDSVPEGGTQRKKKLAGGGLPRGAQSSLLQAGAHSHWDLPG